MTSVTLHAQGFWSKSHDAMLKAPSLVRPLIQFRFDASMGLRPISAEAGYLTS
jgi:hypothetical protein